MWIGIDSDFMVSITKVHNYFSGQRKGAATALRRNEVAAKAKKDHDASDCTTAPEARDAFAS